ncbi:MAG: TlpA disulfide reductase family protein [Clostridia bacterium]|nr:TlpA disulfide reductase family protein [Clostridia bacterium]
MRAIKLICTILTVAVLFAATAVGEESAGVYALGDKVDDFTVTMSDGRTFSLYGLLEEKDAVVINIWGTFCSPCRQEFPFMEQAYQLMKDDIEILALSIYPPDTDEVITQYQEEMGLTFPMGRDSAGMADKIPLTGYPTTAIVDRNGILCFYHTGAVYSLQQFISLFGTYTADGYDESVLMLEVPAIALPEASDSVALSAAANAEGSDLVMDCSTQEDVAPFVPSDDGSCACAANVEIPNTRANMYVEVNAAAGDVMTYEYRVDGATYLDRMTVSIAASGAEEVTAVKLYTGENGEWTQDGVKFDEDGSYTVHFDFFKGLDTGDEAEAGEVVAQIRNVKLITGDEAAAWEDPFVQSTPRSLSGNTASIDILSDAREFATLDNYGNLEEAFMKLYVIDGDVRLRINLGDGIDERFLILGQSDAASVQYHMLSGLEKDESGALLETSISPDVQYTHFMLTNVISYDTYAFIMLFPSEEAVNSYIKTSIKAVYPEVSLDNIDVAAYMDGTPFEAATGVSLHTALDASQKQANDVELPSEATYVVRYIDEEGNPVTGVMTQVCDEGTCAVVVSDENGLASHTAAPYPYEIHVLMVPEGFAPVEEIFTMDEAGGEITVTLLRN